MKQVKIHISIEVNQSVKMLPWNAYPTIIPGLFIGKPLGEDYEPALDGWLIYHEKSGKCINFDILKNLYTAKQFINSLALQGLDWTKLDKEIDKNLYMEAIKKASDAPKIMSYSIPSRFKPSKITIDYPNSDSVLLLLDNGIGINGKLFKSLLRILNNDWVNLEVTESSLIVRYGLGRAELKNCYDWMIKEKRKNLQIVKLEIETEGLF